MTTELLMTKHKATQRGTCHPTSR